MSVGLGRVVNGEGSIASDAIRKYVFSRLSKNHHCRARMNQFDRLAGAVMIASQETPSRHGYRQPGYRLSVLNTPESQATFTGLHMAEVNALIHSMNEELSESKEILEGLSNKARALLKEVVPVLGEMVTALRSSRMAAVSEIAQTVSALRDVRKFFVEEGHEDEMARLERFVALCKELKTLKDEGVLDAVCDTSLRLAVKDAP